MNIALSLTYLIAYLIEMCVFLYYTERLLVSLYTKLRTLCIFFAVYLVMFALSYFDKVVINSCSFVLGNFAILIILYREPVKTSFFHTLLVTVCMDVSEYAALLLLGQTAFDYYNPAYFLHNRILFGVISKSLYFILIFFVGNLIYRKDKELSDMRLQLQKEAYRADYYNMLSMQYKEQALFLHDIKNHLRTMLSLCDASDKSDNTKLSAYISDILDSGAFLHTVKYSDNTLLNTILSRYGNEFNEKDIAFYTDIRANALNFLPARELTALICNLLDNALEAACDTADKYVDLYAERKENTRCVLIKLRNSCNSDPIDPHSNRLISKKADSTRHGLGMQSIARIADKYNGTVEYSYNSNKQEFMIVVMLATR